jgi:Rrf2 family protein
MVFLADNHDDLYSVNRLHKILNIPYKYLGRLMNKLTHAGLLKVTQGKHGGYQINTGRGPIYLYQIIGVVEGLDNYERCILGFEECSDENPCSLHKYWYQYKEGIKEMIYNTRLQDLENGGQIKY